MNRSVVSSIVVSAAGIKPSKKRPDETLFLEMALRGYDLSKPFRPDTDKNDTPAEIVKIGEVKDEIL